MEPERLKPGEDTSKIESWRITKLGNGETAVLRDTKQMVSLNTGIVVGYRINHAVDLIHRHPIGPKTAQ